MAEISGSKYAQLDSLRGIAALTVIICHYITRFKISEIGSSFSGDHPLMYLLKYTPLHILWAGHEAVILFFILSGFVLSLSFLEKNRLRYGAYLIKRVCRIYVPYIVVIICAVILRKLFYTGEISTLSDTFNDSWKPPADGPGVLIGHFFMIGNYDTNVYDGSIWSLVHEMRISVLFPFLLLFCRKNGLLSSMITAATLSVCSYLLITAYYIHPYNNVFITVFGENILLTLHYIGLFMLGATVAIHRQRLAGAFRRLYNNHLLPLILCVAVLAYTFSWYGLGAGIGKDIINDWMIAAGASIFIITAISVKKSKLLKHKALVFTGKISYSLYLWHIVILNTLIHSLYGIIPLYMILPPAFLLTVFLSWLSYMFIEVPAIRLGKRLCRCTSGIGPEQLQKS